MTRVPDVHRESLAEELKEAYDTVVAEGQPMGPGSITIHSPEMARRRLSLSAYMRWELKVDQRMSELAILVTARALDCPYVWNAHANLAVKAGVSQAFVDALREGQPLPAAPDDEAAVVNYGMELLQAHKVSDETFMKAHALFGTQHLVELTSLMGHYSQNCLLVNAFEVDLPVPTNGPVLPV